MRTQAYVLGVRGGDSGRSESEDGQSEWHVVT